MTRFVLVPALASVLALGACTQNTDEEPEPVSQAQAQQAIQSIQEGTAAAVAVVNPFVTKEKALSQAQSEEAVKSEVQSGTSSPDSSQPSCTEVTWLGGLSANFSFNQCPTKSGGTVNGDLSLGISFLPTRFAIGFKQLQFDDKMLDGFGMITFQTGKTTLDADFTYTSPGASTYINLNGVTVTVDPTGTTLNGSGALKLGSLNGSFSLAAPRWKKGDCMASSGSLTYTQVNSVPVTATFLPTSPADGVVQIQIGSLPPYSQKLALACSS